MKTTYGQFLDKKTGFYKPVMFPVLAKLDTWTTDGRMIEAAGFGVRDLPLSIKAQFTDAPGHSEAMIVGTLQEVTVDGDTLSGRGWFVDTDEGRKAAFLMDAGALRFNSVDLADVEADLEYTEDMTMKVRFRKARLGATTIVALPAFAEAYGEVDSDEIMASFEQPFHIGLEVKDEEEIMASGIIQAWDVFHIPESDEPQKIVVDENGYVFGHLGLWNSCHDGVESRCVRIPRPQDNYASFNKPGVMTDQGLVETGPIFLSGGHRYGITGDDWADAYGGIENAWADVRVTTGRLGPWISGVVRPGVPEEMLYAARASRISGHWKGGRLKAIVSVNAEGYDVPGSGFSFKVDDEGEVLEMVASFPPCGTMSEPFEEFQVNLNVPTYIRNAARRGLELYEQGEGGGGLTSGTIREARAMARGEITEDKVIRANAWGARHAVDLQAPQNSNSDDPQWPGAGAVAHYLWGINPLSPNGARNWFESKANQIKEERGSASSDVQRLALLVDVLDEED